MPEECTICWTDTSSAVAPCHHPVCHRCATLWLQKSPTCPICRRTVVDVSGRQSTGSRDVIVPLHVDARLGVTVTDHAYGVVLSYINRHDQCGRSGLRRGDVVTHLNGIRITTHANAILIINEAKRLGYDLAFTILERRSATWFRWRCFNKKHP